MATVASGELLSPARRAPRRNSVAWVLFCMLMIAGAVDVTGDYIDIFNISRFSAVPEVDRIQSISVVLMVLLAGIGIVRAALRRDAFRLGLGSTLYLVFFTIMIVLGSVTGLLRGNQPAYILGDARNLIIYPTVFAVADTARARFGARVYWLFRIVCGIVLVKFALAVATFVLLSGSSPFLVRFLLKLTPFLIGLAMINLAWLVDGFRLSTFGLFGAATLAIVMSQTRGVLLGYVGGFLCIWLVQISMKRGRRLLVPSALILAGAAVMALSVWTNPEATEGRWSGEHFDVTVSIRLEQMSSFMSLYAKHPVFGIGLGGYDPDYARFSEDLTRPYLQELEYHNLLAKLGTVGMLCFVSAFVFLFYDCWRRIKASASRRTKGLIGGLAAGLFGMLIASATNPLYSSIYFHTYVVLLLLTLAWARRQQLGTACKW